MVNHKRKGARAAAISSAALIAVASALTEEEREVVAFMISRSLSSNIFDHTSKCGCFDCYSIYWLRWHSSPHSLLIHQAIDSFEQHHHHHHHLFFSKPLNKHPSPPPPPPPLLAGDPLPPPQQEAAAEGGGAPATAGTRLVLPDVVGLLRSRFLSFWSPVV